MGGLVGSKPQELFIAFRDHLNSLLHKTITDCPLSLVTTTENRAFINFGTANDPIAAPLRTAPWHLYLGQVLSAVQIGKKSWRLRTLKYSYWLQDGPTNDDKWFLRYEYVSRELGQSIHPRHHVHIPANIQHTKPQVDLTKIHLATGWVTVEELIRFLISEIGVKSRNAQWDRLLSASEEAFRLWTARSI